MQDPDLDVMISLALEKQRLIKKFLKLTEEQAEAIKNDNYDSMLKTINKKQHIIEKVNLLALNGPSNVPEENESLRNITNNTREIMARAILIDDKNILLLQNNQVQIFEKLKNARQNKMTHTVYRGKNISIEGILVDKKK